MNMNVKFEETACVLRIDFGQKIEISGGGYERGYEEGRNDGFTAGQHDAASVDAEWLATGGAVTKRYNPVAKTIGDSVFNVDVTLEEIDFPAVESVGAMAFGNCTALCRVNLPALVNVGNSAFRACSALIALDFPRATNIDRTALRGCTNLETLILRADSVCALGNAAALSQTKIENGAGFIYVPDNLVEQYKTAANWSTYASQIKPLSELE